MNGFLSGLTPFRWSGDVVISVAAIVLAVSMGVSATSDLHWPYDWDSFRDMASTQTIVDGSWGADPFYDGERAWYNPLVPSLAAAVTWLGGVPVHLVYARGGAYLNALVPIAFFVLVRSTLGPLPATAATVAFLFGQQRGTQAWDTATYSPWLFPTAFAQALFYATAASLQRLWADPTGFRRAAAGLLLGLTLLAHTSAAILLMAMLLLHAAYHVRTAAHSGLFKSVGAVLSVAMLVSLPLTWSIVGHYRLQVVNSAPMTWEYGPLRLATLWPFLSYLHTAPALALALLGIVAFARSGEARRRGELFAWWGLANVLFLLRGYLSELSTWVETSIPMPVPNFHFVLYIRGLLTVFAGYGFACLSIWIAAWLAPRTIAALHFARWTVSRPEAAPSTGAAVRERRMRTTLSYALVVLVAVVIAPRLLKRDDLTVAVDEARRVAEKEDNMRAYAWIRSSTPRGDVFLTPDGIALMVVGPAGRKVVSVNAYFSNPFVDRERRTLDSEQMYSSLFSGDRVAFCEKARQYNVRFVTLDGEQSSGLGAGSPVVREVFGSGSIHVWRVVGC